MSETKSDAAKPRGKMTAYSYFVQICREQIKKDFPQEPIDFGVFNKRCGEKWRTMTDNEKEKFVALAEKDKERYEAELKEYGPPMKKRRQSNEKKRTKDPNAPKRALSAFFCFCNDERPKVKEAHPDFMVKDVAKELGKRWSEVDPDCKRKYEELSNQDKERYQKEMTAYKNKGHDISDEAMMSPTTKESGQNGEHNNEITSY